MSVLSRRWSPRFAILTAVLLTVLAVPWAASAIATTRGVTFQVLIEHVNSAPLAGVRLEVRSDWDGPAIASGVSGLDGRVELQVPEGMHVVDAVWPGAQGELDDIERRAEFVTERADEPVTVTFAGPHGTVSGTVSATVDGDPADDLGGAQLEILSDRTVVQHVPVEADGSYVSGAVPATTADDYALRLVPPAGLTLASSQPANAAFGVTAPGATIDRTFALATPAPPPTTPSPTTPTTPSPTSPAPTSAAPDIARLYVAYFGRPADSAGLSFWASALDGDAMSAMTRDPGLFMTGPEAGLLSVPTHAQFADLYQNLFGRADDSAGMEFWRSAVAFTPDSAMLDRIAAADGGVGDALAGLRDAESPDATSARAAVLAAKLARSGFDASSPFLDALGRSDSAVVGIMRSKPVALGTARWKDGRMVGSFDLSEVPAGDHHLFLAFEDLGMIVMSKVTVPGDVLPATGPRAMPSMGLAVGIVVLGAACLAGARFLGRRPVVR